MTKEAPLPTLEHLLCTYTETYAPQNEADETLIRQLALATLRLRRLEAAEATLWQQSEPDLAQLAMFERYRASAERSFFRARKALEALRKERNQTKPVQTAHPEPMPASALQDPQLLAALADLSQPTQLDRAHQFLASRGLHRASNTTGARQ